MAQQSYLRGMWIVEWYWDWGVYEIHTCANVLTCVFIVYGWWWHNVKVRRISCLFWQMRLILWIAEYFAELNRCASTIAINFIIKTLICPTLKIFLKIMVLFPNEHCSVFWISIDLDDQPHTVQYKLDHNTKSWMIIILSPIYVPLTLCYIGGTV